MAECAKCGKKLGFFSSKHDYKGNKGSNTKYCNGCHEKELEKERKRLEKEETELKKKVLPMVNNFIGTLEEDKLAQLYGIYKNEKPFSMIDDASLDKLRSYVTGEISRGHKAATQGWVDFGTGYNPADHVGEFEACLSLLDDIEKVKGIIEKKCELLRVSPCGAQPVASLTWL